jgi:hypothetical protein
MSAVLERAFWRKPSRQLIRKVWSAWTNGDERVRVQTNDHELAKAFAKVKGVTRTGYSVMGPFTAIYLTQHTRDWVEDWMKGQNKGAQQRLAPLPSLQTKP